MMTCKNFERETKKKCIYFLKSPLGVHKTILFLAKINFDHNIFQQLCDESKIIQFSNETPKTGTLIGGTFPFSFLRLPLTNYSKEIKGGCIKFRKRKWFKCFINTNWSEIVIFAELNSEPKAQRS